MCVALPFSHIFRILSLAPVEYARGTVPTMAAPSRASAKASGRRRFNPLCACFCPSTDDSYESTETGTATTGGIKLNLAELPSSNSESTTLSSSSTSTTQKTDNLPPVKFSPRMFKDRSDPTERLYNSLRRSSASDLGRTLREGVQPEPADDEEEAAPAPGSASAPAAAPPAAAAATPVVVPASDNASSGGLEAGWQSPP